MNETRFYIVNGQSGEEIAGLHEKEYRNAVTMIESINTQFGMDYRILERQHVLTWND